LIPQSRGANMAHALRKLRLLIWKNFVLQVRKITVALWISMCMKQYLN